MLRYGQKKIHPSKVVPMVVQTNQSQSWYGYQWCNDATIATASHATASHATASQHADESGLSSIGTMAVEIWPKEDPSIQGGSNGGTNQPKSVLVWLPMVQ